MNHNCAYFCFGVLLAGFSQNCGVADNISDGSPIAPPGAPRSVFISLPGEDGFGKDPFYPRSTRFIKQAAKVEDVATVKQGVPESVVLNGISLLEGRKLAIINNYTVAEGEDFTLRIDGKLIKGQCVEIKVKSAVVKVSGETKEIPLRSNLP